MRFRAAALLVTLAVAGVWPSAGASGVETTASFEPAAQRADWKQHLDRAIGDRRVSVAVRLGGAPLYRHGAARGRVPASNQKLLVTMALMDRLPAETRFATRVEAQTRSGSTIPGDVWLVGRGDPSLAGSAGFGRRLPFRTTRLGQLARQLQRAGITRISGSVVGARTY